MISGRKDSLAVLVFLGLLTIFYPGLFLIKTAPLIGDSLEQHYPWAYQLAQSLNDFRLPFWTPLIQCGFPLVAESQVGAFYLPNLILLGLFPFHVAYSYMNLLHWFIAGWGTYFYAKQMKLGAMASFVAGVVFVFGGAYGGAYYNMTSLKTICWFPVGLYLFERYLEKPKWLFLLGLAVAIGQSIVAGYLQMAALAWLMFGAYVLLRIFIFPENSCSWIRKTLTLGTLTLTALLALLLALPQIYLTFQLAVISNRTGLEEAYAYVGSMSPFALGTLVIPKLSLLLRGNNLYQGSFALLLVLCAFFSPEIRKDKTFRLWGVMTLLALLLALGQWSPLYVALIKLTKFYSFRFPAKFLVYICFGLAMLSAVGFQALWQGKLTQVMIKKAFHAYLGIVTVFVALMVVGNLFLTVGKNVAMKLGGFYVTHFIYAKPGHPHTLETYLGHVKNYPAHALRYISLSDPANIWMIAVSGICVFLFLILLRQKTIPRSLLLAGIFFLVVDLYAASYQDIQWDLVPYKTTLAPSPFLKILDEEKLEGHLGRILGFRDSSKRLPLTPSQNMLYGIEDIGVYSPLVPKRYFESIGLLGNVNDSNYQRFPVLDFILQRLPLLSFLNVSHIVSSEPIAHIDLKLLGRDNELESFLYKNTETHQPAYFISRVEIVQDWEVLRTKLMTPHFDPGETLLLEKEELQKMTPRGAFSAGVILNGISIGRETKDLTPEVAAATETTIQLQRRQETLEEWQVETVRAGFFVISETFYPGWHATVNGQSVETLKADGLFRAIWIDGPGSYKIRFQYKPFSKD